MKKRLSAGLLCLCLIIALVPVTVFADEADQNWTEYVTEMPGSGYQEDAAGNVSISSPEGLAWLASLVNGFNGKTASDFSGRTITLAEDIDLEGHDWIPIGRKNAVFSGSFDGNGKKITNMYVNLSSAEVDGDVYAGLFGVTANASLRNINVDGIVYISGDAENNYAGGIAAYLSGGLLSKSNSLVDVYISAGSNKENYAGSIAGYNQGGTIDEVSKLGMVEIYTLMIGFGSAPGAGSNPGPEPFGDFDDPDITINYAGGILGVNNSGLIKNSSAYDHISVSCKNSWNFAGGIVGKNNSGTIEACVNAVGSVTSEGDSSTNYAGGISGVNSSKIVACPNYSTVKAAGYILSLNYAGGIAGVNYGEISRSFNGHTVSGTGADAYNAAGGIAGRNDEDATVTDCYNIASIEASGNMSGDYPYEEFCNDAGGLVGSNLGRVINSYNQGDVTAAGTSTENDAGGLAGYNVDGAILANSYNTASVTAAGTSLNQAGGLVGANENAHLANSYNRGTVSASGGENFSGGVAGKNERGIVANSYWLESAAAQGFGQGSGTSCVSFSQAQGKGLETTPSFKYKIGTGKERTGTLVMALNAWVKKPSQAVTPYSYQTWTIDENENSGYPIFGTPAPGEEKTEIPDDPGETIPLPTDPDLPTPGEEETEKPGETIPTPGEEETEIPDDPGETIPLPTDPDLPQTGESRRKPLIPILLILAGLSILVLILYRKKNRP